MSREEELLSAILNDTEVETAPKSRIEKIWHYALGAEIQLDEPKSRIEKLAIRVAEKVREGGGVKPTGTLTITANGNYDVTEYAGANVNVPTSQDYTNEDGLLKRGGLTGSYTNPRVTVVKDYAFDSQVEVNSISLPNAVVIGKNAFASCSKVSYLNMPKVTSIPMYALLDCTNLRVLDLPQVTTLETYAMNGAGIRDLNAPLLSVIGNGAFRSCSSLYTLNAPSVTQVNQQAFEYSKLTTLNFYSPTRTAIPILKSYFNPFEGTPIKAGTGHIVINDELVDTLKAATNWSTYANVIIGHTDAIAQGIITA